MKPLAEDLRYAFRILRKSPGFTVVAILTLALAMGATSTIFSAVNAVLLRGLPYPDPGRLVLIWGEERQRGIERGQVSYPEVEEWLRQNQVFEDVAAYTGAWTPALSGPSEVMQLGGMRVSDRFFRVMKTQALLGRTFLPGEQFENGGDVAVLSYGLWERSFGKDPSIVGHKISLDGKPYSVVGVLPESFRPLPVRLVDQVSEIYRPLSKDFSDEIRNGRHLRSIARLKPGVSLDRAKREMNVIARRLELAFPDENQGHGVHLVGMHDDLVEGGGLLCGALTGYWSSFRTGAGRRDLSRQPFSDPERWRTRVGRGLFGPAPPQSAGGGRNRGRGDPADWRGIAGQQLYPAAACQPGLRPAEHSGGRFPDARGAIPRWECARPIGGESAGEGPGPSRSGVREHRQRASGIVELQPHVHGD